MSETNKEPTSPQKPFHEGPTRSGRLSRAKKAGWTVFALSVTAMIVITLFSLVSAKTGSGLIVSLDRTARDAHFSMSLQPNNGSSEEPGQEIVPGQTLLVGEPLGNADLVGHSKVKAYYEAQVAEKGVDGGLSGSWNYIEDGTAYALFYTFYLNNSSSDEPQTFRVAARLNSALSQGPEAVGKRPYDFARLAVFAGNNGSPDDYHAYFANRNTLLMGTEEDPQDYRECLARTRTQWAYTKEGDESSAREYRIPAYSETFNEQEISFCNLFDPGVDGMGLFDIEQTIPAGGSRRITFVTYLEGEDPDSYTSSPIDQKLGFSLIIGV